MAGLCKFLIVTANFRILHVITRLDPGGSATNTIVTVDLLRKHGFETFLAYGETREGKKGGQLLAEKGIQSRKLKHMVRNPDPLRDWLALREIEKLLKEESFDLVHTLTSKAGVLGRIAARKSGLPSRDPPKNPRF